MAKIKVHPPVNISNNVFTGVNWDKQAVEGVNLVARALLNLTELYRSQNIEMGPMIKIGESEVLKEKEHEQ